MRTKAGVIEICGAYRLLHEVPRQRRIAVGKMAAEWRMDK